MKAATPWLLTAFALTVSACDKPAAEPSSSAQAAGNTPSSTNPSSAPPAGATPPVPSTPPSSPSGSAPSSKEYALPAVPRWVAIGDLHGDLSATQQALELAGAIDAKGHWIGGNLVVVQTGDQLDRGDDERGILDLLERVAGEARDAGGALHVLNGNHEAMNVLGDFRYVTPAGYRAFDDVTPRAALAERWPSEARGRAGAFLPGGGEALRLSRRRVVVQVGDTVFVHGGIRAPHVTSGLDRLNRETAAWMRGSNPQPPRLVQDPEGPLWTRVYGGAQLDSAACAVLDEALKALGAARMVVGHSVQEGGISAACDGRVQRIDVGLSRYYQGATLQVLEYRDGQLRVLGTPRKP